MKEKIHITRYIMHCLPDPDKNRRRLILLTGARQTGKTTLAQEKYPDIKYINLDSAENRDFVKNIPTDLWYRDIGEAIIDEAQKEPSVFEKIKYAYDAENINFQIILGSSQILLLKRIRESLAGRVSIYELWPLLITEICNESNKQTPLIDKIISASNLDNILFSVPSILPGEKTAVYKDAENYLSQWGGMPALLHLKSDERWKWLKDYEYTYLERDLSDLARLDDLYPFRKFQKLSSLRSARLLNYSEIARDAAISVDTARRYLEYLNISYQVILIQPFYKNLTSSVIKTPKLYWLDLGILRQLSGYKGELTGEIYETMVVSEIYKWIKTTQRDTEIYFYRTRSGLEMDLLLKTPSGFIGIEIKTHEEIAKTDYRPMIEIANKLGKEWIGGLIVYKGNILKKVSDPSIWAVPSYRLFNQ